MAAGVRTWRLTTLAIVGAALLTSSPEGVAAQQASSEKTRIPSPAQAPPDIHDALRARAAAHPVRVIIGLDAPARPEGELSTMAAAFQRAEIAQQQAEALAVLGSHARGPVVAFESIPFMSLYLDADGLDAAAGLSSVRSIVEDVPVTRLLSASSTQIGARALWSAGIHGGGTSIAVLDDGMQTSHPYLRGATRDEACFGTRGATQYGAVRPLCPNGSTTAIGSGAASACQSSVQNVCDHGTHVSGIARYVAERSWIIPIQVFSEIQDPVMCAPNFSCLSAFNTDVIRALEYVSNLAGPGNAARIAAANLSLGGGAYAGDCDGRLPAYKAIIDTLRSKRIATVVASGNEGRAGSMSAPACISSAVSVGSVTKSDQPTDYSNIAANLSLLAPGHDIVSSVPIDRFRALSGTSMAAPHVAGGWAILANAFPQRSVQDILSALRQTGRVINDAGFLVPRIQLDAAHRRLAQDTPAPQAPGAPRHLTATVHATTVTLSWSAPADGGPAHEYIVEAGSAAGLTNFFNGPVGPATSLTATIGSGTYFVRVRARNAAGVSAPSNEVMFVVGASPLPGAPSGLRFTRDGGGIVFTWSAAPGMVVTYVVEAGSAPGLSNLASVSVGASTAFAVASVPPGVYYVRVRAQNATGLGPPSNEVTLTVP